MYYVCMDCRVVVYIISTLLSHAWICLCFDTQCPVLLVQPTRAHDAIGTAILRGLQEHLVLEDTAGVMGHASMMAVPAYVSLLVLCTGYGNYVVTEYAWFLLYTAHVSGCLIEQSPSTHVGFPTTDGSSPETVYGCVSSTVNCEYEVHVIAIYESRDHGFGAPRVAENTYVQFNINGRSSKPLVLVFTSYEPVNWQLSLPSGVVVNRILVVCSLIIVNKTIDISYYIQFICSLTQGGYYTGTVTVYPATNVEVVPRNNLSSGYGSDDGGGHTADNLIYLTKRFGPISSFSGSYRADRWTVNIERSPGNYICLSSVRIE